MTPDVTTLWYRAPEVLLNDKHYSESVDIWSAGCVIAEMLLMRPLLPGKDEVDQLQLIHSTVEPLSSSSHLTSLSNDIDFYKNSLVRGTHDAPQYTSLEQQVRHFDTLTQSFLRHILRVDPEARPSAAEALDHFWLKQR